MSYQVWLEVKCFIFPSFEQWRNRQEAMRFGVAEFSAKLIGLPVESLGFDNSSYPLLRFQHDWCIKKSKTWRLKKLYQDWLL